MEGRLSATPNELTGLKTESPVGNFDDRSTPAPRPMKRRWTIRLIALAAGLIFLILVIVALAVVLPVYFKVIRPRQQSSSSSSGPGGAGSNPSSPSGATSGGDGSVVILDNGTSFTYTNSFGGYWVSESSNPFNNNARPNSWTPPINTTWDWGNDHIYGVNLGGLFVLEPFITPSIFQRYPGSQDEYTLSQALRANNALDELRRHYDTFITELDIAEIAGAGMNFIRVPIPFWAIETWDGEPFLAKESWTYFLRILKWARKYGLRVCTDLHTLPGSQNGLNHSGRLSPVNFLNGNMGIANAQRALYYIRVLTEFISQPEYRELVPLFGIINEALIGVIGKDAITSFYIQAHDMIRSITGRGEGNGPYIVIHDGFQPLTTWAGFLAGSDRMILDQHQYLSFGAIMTDPINVPGPDGLPGGKWPRQACDSWGPSTNDSKRNFGITMAGEFSGSFNDCGIFLRGVSNANSTNPQCPEYNDWRNFNSTMKQGLMNFALANMDAFQDWFFWTWKVNSTETGEFGSPLWSYQLGLQNGWLPTDPRTAVGKCNSLGSAAANPFNGQYSAWQTGQGASTSIAAASSQSFPWPPPTISGAGVPVSLIPTYTNTAPLITLPTDSFSGAPSSVTQSVDGWFNNNDKSPGVTSVAGCTYPDEYNGIFSGGNPTQPCTGSPAATQLVI